MTINKITIQNKGNQNGYQVSWLNGRGILISRPATTRHAAIGRAVKEMTQGGADAQ